MSGELSELSRFKIVREFAVNLLKKNTLSDLCWVIANAIGQLPGFEDSVVYLKQNNRLVQVAAFGVKAAKQGVVEPLSLPIGSGIVGTVATTGVAEIVNDTTMDPRYIPDCYPGRSELTVPVVYQGEVIAILDSEHGRRNAYSTQHLEILQAMADVCASRIASAIVEEQNKAAAVELSELNSRLEARVEQRTSELANVAKTAESQRRRLETILNVLQDGLLLLNARMEVVMASPSAYRILETTQVLEGLPVDQVLKFKANKSPLISLIKEQKSADEQDSILVCHNQLEKEIQLNVAPLTLDGRQENGTVVTFRDVTRQNFLHRQNDQLARMKSLGILAGGIAHDFNNNLAAILASLEFLEKGKNGQDAQALSIARTACKNSALLTKQFMGYAKGGDPVRKPASLRELIGTATSLTSLENRTTLALDIPETLPSVMVDPGQLIQVFSNIFLNSIQAIGGGGQITVQARLLNESSIETSISDTGPGFAEESLERVFEPYFTSRDSGTGLGLTNCYFIVRKHGGEITATNLPDGGALLRFTLPVTDRDPIESTVSKNAKHAEALRILLLDDDALVQRSVSMMLQKDGHYVDIASDGDELLDLIADQKSPFDIALLDLQVPNGQGGESIIDDLKSQLAIPCVAISGYSDSASLANPKEHGFDAGIHKPFSLSEFYGVVEPLLTRVHLKR